MRRLVGLGLAAVLSTAIAGYQPGQYSMQSIHSADFRALVQDVHQHYGQHMLLVFDDDNTLETTDKQHYGYLGGVAWFNWQADLLKNHLSSSQLVARNFAELLKVQWYLFQHIPMVEAEAGLAKQIQQLEASGVPVLVETSRGPVMSAVTYQSLKAQHFNSNYQNQRFWAPFIPGKASCGVGHQKRWASYEHSVFYTSGQNKGKLLTCLFNRAQVVPQAIVFVDDTIKNDSDVWQHFKQNNPEVAVFTIHDTHFDQTVASFGAKQKQQATVLWQKMKPGYEQWRNAFTPPSKSV